MNIIAILSSTERIVRERLRNKEIVAQDSMFDRSVQNIRHNEDLYKDVRTLLKTFDIFASDAFEFLEVTNDRINEKVKECFKTFKADFKIADLVNCNIKYSYRIKQLKSRIEQLLKDLK